MPIQTIWRSKQGELFHNDCFEEGESKDGYTEVKLADLEEDDECESCGGVFLAGVLAEEEGDEANDDEDEGDDD